jgi:hypothetical protein
MVLPNTSTSIGTTSGGVFHRTKDAMSINGHSVRDLPRGGPDPAEPLCELRSLGHEGENPGEAAADHQDRGIDLAPEHDEQYSQGDAAGAPARDRALRHA